MCSRIVEPMFGLDVASVRIDERLPAVALRRIARRCRGGAKQTNPPARANPQWKAVVVLRQPSKAALETLEATLAADIRYEISWVELACDIPTRSRNHALMAQQEFIQAAVLKHSTEQIEYKGTRGTTVYFAPRRSQRINLAVYADRPSKLHGARSTAIVLHIEFRAHSAPMVRQLGIETLADLASLEFKPLFSRLVGMYQLPTSKIGFGRLLGDGRKVVPSGTALRARVSRLMNDRSLYVIGVPSMQRLKLARPELIKKLRPVSFTRWLKWLGGQINGLD